MKFVAVYLLGVFSLVQSGSYNRPRSSQPCPGKDSRGPCRCEDKRGSVFRVRNLFCDDFGNTQHLLESLNSMRGMTFTTVKLSNGNLTAYSPDILKGIEAVHLSLIEVEVDQTLDFSEGQIERIETISLEKVRGLDLINWSKAFGNLWFLHQFQVEDSSLKSLSTEFNQIGYQGSYMQSIRVSGADINCADDMSLSTFSKARIIDFSKNRLTKVRRKMFPMCFYKMEGQPCLELNVLNLSYNYLTTLPDDLLSGFDELSQLILTGNRLMTLKQELIRGSLTKKISIDVYDNRVKCGKNLCWILTSSNVKVTAVCEGVEFYSFAEALRRYHCSSI